MSAMNLTNLGMEISKLRSTRVVGRVAGVGTSLVQVSGLSHLAALGDRVRVTRRDGTVLSGEVLQMRDDRISVLADNEPEGVTLGDRVTIQAATTIDPSDEWIGRVIDPFGHPLDGRSLARGPFARPLRALPPSPATRRRWGDRLETGMAAFNTLLPIVTGQRIGLFAGSGVGKSNLLGNLGRHMEADVVVFALIGERGRELREFIEKVLGPEGLARSIIVTATSDRSPLVRRRCAWAAMSIAEHFRDQGRHVLFLADSITRFAEAHREVAIAAGELPSLRGFPASTSHMIMSLCERAGPGEYGQGDITAIFSVLVAGSDMDEPVADILRGVLDGHVVMDRQIAERGRYPAIDLLRSVSRSLPDAASDPENIMIAQVRRLLGVYARSETMIRAGLYAQGSDPELDLAIQAWSELDKFIAEREATSVQNSFDRLGLILRRAGVGRPTSGHVVKGAISRKERPLDTDAIEKPVFLPSRNAS